jgi:hypothetical protein
MTWLPRATHPTLELRRDWDTSWERLRLSGGVPYLPHGVLLDRYPEFA